MRIIKRQTLQQFWEKHPETAQPLRAWFQMVRAAAWEHSADIKAMFPKASIIDAERVVFNICGGNYRLVVAVHYAAKIVFIKFIGTHAQYDKIDAATVKSF
jgi:mRNA interferase HigB